MTTLALPERRLGVTIAAVLIADACLHLYWTTGARWPATSEHALSIAVLGFDVDFRPAILVPLALVLLAGAGTVLARVYAPRYGRLWRLGTMAVTVGLLIRGLAGVVWAIPGSVPDGFYWVNLPPVPGVGRGGATGGVEGFVA